jgi:predicted dehydrogenase
MQKLRVGAIGYGYWGPNLIRNFAELPDSTLCAVAEMDQNRLLEVQRRYPQVYTTRNYHDLFSQELDAVVIATPPHTHTKIVRDCLQHGLHSLVEKPLTLNSEDAHTLIQVAAEQQRVLMVGHTFEYNPAVRALKAMLQSGELGEIQYIDTVRVSLGLFQRHLNVVWDLAPHDISILLYLLDAMPTSVSAWGTACVQQGIEDVAYLSLRFPGDILTHIRVSWLDPCKTRRITVVGSKKMVIYDDVEPQEKIKVYDKGVKIIRHTDTFGEFQFAYHYGDIVSPYLRLEEPLRLECSHFLECIREGKQPQTDGYNGLRVVQILEAAQQSLQSSGAPIACTGSAMNGLVHPASNSHANGHANGHANAHDHHPERQRIYAA